MSLNPKPSSWKTTLLGLASLGLSIGSILAPPATQAKLQQAAAIMASSGLVAAKDHAN